jgi:hypothetical protein
VLVFPLQFAILRPTALSKFLDNLYRFIAPAVAGPKRLVSLAVLADRGVSEDALRMAASRGRLHAHKGREGQTGRSNRASVDEYRAARQLHERSSPAK